MKRTYLIGLLVLLLVAGIAYVIVSSRQTPQRSDGTLAVTTSFYPLYFFASRIGGEQAVVTNLTPAGAEPHDYEPTTQDTARIQESDVLVLNGSVEPWGDKVSQILSGSSVRVVRAGEDLVTKRLVEDGAAMNDPHVWLDPVLAKKEAEAVEKGFAAADPAHADYYASNAQKLYADLDRLDADYRAGLATCATKDIITSHEAFAYLAERYGLEQVAIADLSPDQEPSPAQLAKITDFARAHQVKYIFFESLVSPRLAETIAKEVGAQTLVLDPLEGISDADQAAGRDYFSVMRDNLKNLQTALSCKT